MQTIETHFIDVQTHNTIAQVALPIERLPQSFAQATTFHIAGEDWSVVKADPITAEEYIQTGKLVIMLKKLIRVPVKDILYTLPSLCNEIPGTIAGSTKQGKRVFELHEDDWRQTEFIASSYEDVINSEIQTIRKIYTEASIDNGHFLAFQKISVREQITTPLPQGIALDRLIAFLPPDLLNYEGIAYQQSDELIHNGFAFSAGSIIFYGQQAEGLVNVLGIKVLKGSTTNNLDMARSLQAFMEASDLFLVDWYKPQCLTANQDMIINFLDR